MNRTSTFSLARGAAVLGATALLAAVASPAVSPAAAGAPPPADPVPLTPCVSTDNGSPVVQRVAVNHRLLDTSRHPETLLVTVHAIDTGGPGAATGIVSGSVSLDTVMTVDSFYGVVAMDRPLRHVRGTAWVATFHFPRHAGKEHTWQVGISLKDHAGNTGGGYDDTTDPQYVRVRSGRRLDPSFARIRFSHGPYDTHKQAVRVPVTVRMSNRAPVSTLQLRVGDPHRHRHLIAQLRRVPGKPSVFIGHWLIPRFQTGHWRLTGATVVSSIPEYWFGFGAAGLRHLAGHGFQTLGARQDTVAPRVVSYDQSPAQVDVTHTDQSITSTVHAVDARAGVTRIRVTHHLTGDPDAFTTSADLHRVAGTAQNGTWTGPTTLTPCHSTPGTWVTVVDAWDASGNHVRLGPRVLARSGWPARVQVTGADHLLPRVVASSDDGLTVAVAFGEPVTGISETSAFFFFAEHMVDDFDYVGDGPPIPGSWACQDATGSTTDCATGAVTTATFTITGGLQEWDTLEFNSNHVLAARDLHGNPFDHTRFGVDRNDRRHSGLRQSHRDPADRRGHAGR